MNPPSGNDLHPMTLVLRRLGISLFTVLSFALATGCTMPRTPRLPPVTAEPTGQTIVGKFVWFDLLTKDVEAAKHFYRTLFGWEVEAARGMTDYAIIRHGGNPIGGIVAHEDKNAQYPDSLWLGSLSVADVDRAVDLIRQGGGEILEGPLNVHGRGRLAVVRDPQGAELIVLRASGGDPVDRTPAVGDWLWVDFFTRDIAAATDFYTALVEYQAEDVKEGRHVFRILRREGHPRAGIVQMPLKDVEPNWLPYVRVDDVDHIVKQATSLGGNLILRVGDVAILTDPTGAAIGVQHH